MSPERRTAEGGRLDRALADRGFARSRSHAQQLIHSGLVRVSGQIVRRPAERVDPETSLEVVDATAAGEVSRAGGKLRGALAAWDVTVPGRCVDIGSSTGGFTQVLLEHGAATVFAVDVGTDQLESRLRQDPRVQVREQTNARGLTVDDLDGQPVSLAVADVSFISLTLLLDPIFGVLRPDGEALLMVKPQFEVGRAAIADGVVRDRGLREHAVEGVRSAAAGRGWRCIATRPSDVPGPSGNLEYFCWFVGPRSTRTVGPSNAG
ncbi:TlyA family RNA methyltransferase [Propioniferax innocua]|uniref:23S rRNA (Cytidine1920-2'-O)/16S rRNA (Cytidine1409-2'-O)-methyltransferase n=1 Tax=Propioniferax innocua TaxID=1753 RepID=A0A542ZB78_9ACTN|nr:TlyA family RNA methyltransferase [Propioniferax innocua]TQL57541.1 23S rRNA (cytidine1920-2'-O)/16S rRNA (cytidine1409-2'-O)-methyltransferase [Propioniferax innocua]